MVSLASKVKSLFASLVIAGTISNVSANDINDTRIAFTYGGVEQSPKIYTMYADGTDIKRLSNINDFSYSGCWSPDGNRIAFLSYRDGNREIYTMHADGNDIRRITNNSGIDEQPSWSPDGNRIAFHSDRDGNYEIYSMRAVDGSDVRRITNNLAPDINPSWSPDGSRIAFASHRDGNFGDDNFEIYTMRAVDGSDVRRLTNNLAMDSYPNWSPDGSRIAFVSNRDGNYEIYTMRPDGNEIIRITNNSGRDERPSWSPDGSRIAFLTYRGGNGTIYTMSSDGSELVKLVAGSNPSWSPFLPPTYLPSDIDQNTIVDIMDLIKVANKYGSTEKGRWDVNADGVVDITDLILVARHLGEFSAPSRNPFDDADVLSFAYQQMLRAENVNVDKNDNFYSAMNELEKRLEKELPTRTHLLQNYPNPFNPETYIPFALASDGDVKINIYSPDGRRVREIDLGYLQAGNYASTQRAPHWDGRNEQGESVTSGVYFVELRAGNKKDLSKMVVGK